MSSLYVIAIGGTGAKCAEAIMHLAASGLLTPQPPQNSKIKIIFIDPDESNGHIDRAKKTIQTYQACHQLMADCFEEFDHEFRNFSGSGFRQLACAATARIVRPWAHGIPPQCCARHRPLARRSAR